MVRFQKFKVSQKAHNQKISHKCGIAEGRAKMRKTSAQNGSVGKSASITITRDSTNPKNFSKESLAGLRQEIQSPVKPQFNATTIYIL